MLAGGFVGERHLTCRAVADVQHRAVNRLARAHRELGDVGLKHVPGRITLGRRVPLVPGHVMRVPAAVNLLLDTRLEHIVRVEGAVDSDPGRGVPAALVPCGWSGSVTVGMTQKPIAPVHFPGTTDPAHWPPVNVPSAARFALLSLCVLPTCGSSSGTRRSSARHRREKARSHAVRSIGSSPWPGRRHRKPCLIRAAGLSVFGSKSSGGAGVMKAPARLVGTSS